MLIHKLHDAEHTLPSCGWESKGRYGSFRLRMNVWVCR